MVDIHARRLETFRRASDGDSLFHDYRPDRETCPFASLGVSVPCGEIFENVLAETAAPGQDGPSADAAP